MVAKTTLPSPPQASQFAAAFRVLDDVIAAHAFPGCAFGVLAFGKVLLQDALGAFTYDEDSPAVTANTVYDLASVTKVVATTAAAMLLHQRGTLDLDTLLGDLLPEFVAGRAAEDRARIITLRHLLAHNSGLPGYVEFFRTAASPSELLSACFQLPLEAEPGSRAEYSDPGFILLGKALEVSIGESLSAWTHREIFQLLGMSSTEFCPAPANASPDSPNRGRTRISAIAASRAKCRMKMPRCSRASPDMPASSQMCPTCCILRAKSSTPR